jgi:hypothetical protein
MKRDGFNTRGKFGEHTESFIVKDVAGHRHLTATKTGVRVAWNWIPILPMQTLGDFIGPCCRCFVARFHPFGESFAPIIVFRLSVTLPSNLFGQFDLSKS